MAPTSGLSTVSLESVGEMGRGVGGGHGSLRMAEDARPGLDLLQAGAVCAPSRAPEACWLRVPLDQMKGATPPRPGPLTLTPSHTPVAGSWPKRGWSHRVPLTWDEASAPYKTGRV